MNLLPCCPSLSTKSRPEWAFTISLAIARLRPTEPGGCPSTVYCAKRSRMCSRISGGIPGPVSLTSIWMAWEPIGHAITSTRPRAARGGGRL
jgi:hypothetical protein